MGILYNTKRLVGAGRTRSHQVGGSVGREASSGEILMQDSVRDAFTVALKMLGYSLNSTNEDELARKPETC